MMAPKRLPTKRAVTPGGKMRTLHWKRLLVDAYGPPANDGKGGSGKGGGGKGGGGKGGKGGGGKGGGGKGGKRKR